MKCIKCVLPLLILCNLYSYAQTQQVSSDFPQAYQLENLGDSINAIYGELGPVMSPDGQTLYFVVDGRPNSVFGGDDSQEIWYTTKKADGTWSMAKRMPLPFNLDQFNSVESVTADGRTLLIRGGFKNGRIRDVMGFSTSHRTDNGWTMPQQVEIQDFKSINKGKYSNACLASDGKTLLLALSETKDSESNDLYVSFFQDNQWSRPIPFGTDINTTGSEDTPFLAADGKTIYFSSDRPGGLGGQDIYMSRRLDDSWQKWSTPVNLGAPVNTEGWDTYYSMDATGEYAYLVSDKNSRGETDIVRVKLKDELRPEPMVLITGRVFNAQTNTPLNALISYEILSGGTGSGITRTNPATGEYKIVLPYGHTYGFRTEISGFISSSSVLDLKQQPDPTVLDKIATTLVRQVSILSTKEMTQTTAVGNAQEMNNSTRLSPDMVTPVRDVTIRLAKVVERDLFLTPIGNGQKVGANVTPATGN